MPRVTKKRRLLEYVASRGWTLIGDAEWKELRTALPDIAESTLRASGLAIAQPWLGAVQHSLDELELSLGELTRVYEARPDLRRYCRDRVIAAKDRARWMSRNPRIDEGRRALKSEMVEWMLVWLDDPSMFTTWIRVRRRQMD